MKKILSLVMALALVLTAVSALAADSKGGQDIPQIVVTPTKSDLDYVEAQKTAATAGTDAATEAEAEDEIGLKVVEGNATSEALIAAFQSAVAAGTDMLALLPEDVRALIPAGQTKINEMMVAQFEGNLENETANLIVNFSFATKYTAGSKVTVLFGQLTDPITWTAIEGTAKDDGSVDFEVPADLYKAVKNDPFVLAVVSE